VIVLLEEIGVLGTVIINNNYRPGKVMENHLKF
jgi:hypothetical protein